MKKEVRVMVEKIYSDLANLPPMLPSLFTGSSGITLFKFQYTKHLSLTKENPILNLEIQNIAEQYFQISSNSFCDGKAGISWFFSFLFKQGYLDENDHALFIEDDQKLADCSLSMLRDGNYDYLHGAIGIAHRLNYSSKIDHTKYFSAFINGVHELIQVSTLKNMIPEYDLYKNNHVPEVVNLGLSHGITSLLKLCINSYQSSIIPERSKKLSYLIIDYLILHANKGDSIIKFPNKINVIDKNENISRLGWCYGDLTIGFVLYESGRYFKDVQVMEYGFQILKNTLLRRSLSDFTYVMDAGICHGSSGIAHTYNKIWHFTKDKSFKEGRDYWIKKTLEFAAYQNNLAGYMKYNPDIKTYQESYNLLEGISGIGLVLLTYLTEDFSWDHSIMLN